MELAPDGSKPRGESTGGSRPTALSLAARVREKVYDQHRVGPPRKWGPQGSAHYLC